jgi:hypothetical protein
MQITEIPVDHAIASRPRARARIGKAASPRQT